MANVVNVAVVDAWTFTDAANALVTGKVNTDFAKAAYLASAPATTASVTVAAVAGQSGDYAATFLPTAIGSWVLNVSCVHNGITYRWSETFDVVGAAADDLSAVAAQLASLLGRIGTLSIAQLPIATSTGGGAVWSKEVV